MIAGSPLSSNPTSPIPVCSLSPDCPSDNLYSIRSPPPPPCWAAQAQRDLAQAEAELSCLQQRHASEIDSVKRGVERAIHGARREERRLVERVEQDHRDTQQRLEQVHRENMAASRVSQTLLDKRRCKLAILKQQIQEVVRQSGQNENESIQDMLLKEVSDFLQPWEISISLKKVNFKPSAQPNAVTFGDIRVHDQDLCLQTGGCGPNGQLCALHSQEVQCGVTKQQSHVEDKGTLKQARTHQKGRVVKKITLSSWSDQESGDKTTPTSQTTCHWPSTSEQAVCGSVRVEELQSTTLAHNMEDTHLAVPVAPKTKNSERDHLCMIKNHGKNSQRNQGKQLTVLPGQNQPPLQDYDHMFMHNQEEEKTKGNQNSNSRIMRYRNRSFTSPKMAQRETLTSQSCLDLTSTSRPHSCLSQCSDEHSVGTLGDSGRAPSPANSLDSNYTFIISPSNDCSINQGSLNYRGHLSKSAVDLTNRNHPLISGGMNECVGAWRGHSSNFSVGPNFTSPLLGRKQRVPDHSDLYPINRNHILGNQHIGRLVSPGLKQPPVARSLSMSVIDGSFHGSKRYKGERGETVLAELYEDDISMSPCAAQGAPLLRQFGKQGSGRAEFTLPSGIHCTAQGQLFIVDCGNARVQVTDLRGNVLQQVNSSNSEGSSRRCRNYFDIAVNSKGLIALSCAAERALLVFNRHGRLLETFGGHRPSSAKDELEAPRGVTVTRLDEFLVADIRKGNLVAFKLDTKTGTRLERTVVTGFHRPYLVAACLSSGIVAVSERGNETGRVPCIKVLEPGWNTIRVLGVCSGMGPVLNCPWGICVDSDGSVIVADWGETHRVLVYPAEGAGWPLVNQGLSSPRGLALLPEGQLAVSDSMHHCIKVYQYKSTQK